MSARDELFAEMAEHLTRDERNELIDAFACELADEIDPYEESK